MSVMTDKFFEPFSVAQVASMHTMALHCRQYGVGVEHLLVMIEEYMAGVRSARLANVTGARRARAERTKSYGVCPLCSAELGRVAVNTSRCTQVGGGYTHMYLCKNAACIYTQPFVEGD